MRPNRPRTLDYDWINGPPDHSLFLTRFAARAGEARSKYPTPQFFEMKQSFKLIKRITLCVSSFTPKA